MEFHRCLQPVKSAWSWYRAFRSLPEVSSCPVSVHLSLPVHSQATTDLCPVTVGWLAFSRSLCKWSLWCLGSLAQQNNTEIDPCYVYQQFVLFYSWVKFHCMDIAFLKIHLPVGHLNCFQFGATRTQPLWLFLYKALCGHVFLLLLNKYLGAKWLDRRVDVYLILKERVFQSSCIFILISNVWEFQFLHVFLVPSFGIANFLNFSSSNGYTVAVNVLFDFSNN